MNVLLDTNVLGRMAEPAHAQYRPAVAAIAALVTRAMMNVHGLTHILTFNAADFARFPGLTVLDPVAVAGPTPPIP